MFTPIIPWWLQINKIYIKYRQVSLFNCQFIALSFFLQIIKLFYAKVNLAKEGKVTHYKDGHLYYVAAMPVKESTIGSEIGTEMTTNIAYNITYVHKGIYDNIYIQRGTCK